MDRMSKYIDKYSNPNKEDALKGFQQTQRDSQRDERERKRQEEERKRAEERRSREQTRVGSQAIKEIAKSGQSQINQPTTSTPYQSSMLRNIGFSTDRDERKKPYLDFSNNLENDLNTRIATQKALGVKDKDIEQDLVPQEDNTIQERLEKLSTKLRPGKEGFIYGLQEGYYEREIQDMLSRESVRKINGLPNEVDTIEKFIEDHPELQREERNTKIEEWLAEGVRGSGSQIKQKVDSYTHALKQPSTYAWAGAITAASIMAAPFTGGGSLAAGGALLATSPLVAGGMSTAGKAIAMLGPVAGMRFGMKTGAYDNMAKLEARSSYVDLIEAGVDKRIAGPLSETIGAVNGLLEFMQLETAFGAIPGVSDLVGNAKKMALKEFTKKTIKVVGNYGVDLASEVFEEMAQAGVSEMGLELGKYLQDAPDPSTIEGLKVLGKTMTSEDFRDTVLNEGYHALQSMWLTPILSEAGRTGVNQTMQGMYNATERMQVAKISEQENEVARENNKKRMDYIVNENGATDQAIKFVNETLDPQAMAFLASEKTILEDMLQREDITNQDKEKMGGTLEKISTVLSKAMYDEKVENPDIEYRATNRSDVETEMLSDGWLDQATPYNEILNYNIELYKQSKDYDIADTIKEELKKGTNKAEIIRAIEKRVPKKERKPVNLMSMINSVELVQNEIEMQIINNTLGNILEVQANNVENIKTESIIQDIQEETETVEQDGNVDTPQSTTTVDNEVVQGINQPSSENLTQENVVAENAIQEETTDKEVKEEGKVDSKPISTEKYQSADIKKIPLAMIHIDKETYQFRYDTGNEYGATRKYDGVPFNENLADAVLLREDEYNDLWMVNGHHRYNKAMQSGVEFIDAKIISYKDYTVEEARSLGAMINIAQDNASSIDVAKLIRDTGATEEDFANMGVRPNSKVKKDGMALANLNDWIFTQVATKGIPIERAIIIGTELSDSPDGQNQIIKTLDNMEVKGKSITNDILTELIAEVKGTAREEFTEMTLFGEETFTKNFSIERAELVSYVKSQLKGRVSLLKNVSKNKNAAILQELGNTIAVDDNVKEMNTADQALFILDKTLNYQGTKVNELFNNLAREYAETDNKANIKKKALNELITLMESGNMFDLINQQVKKADVTDSITGEQTMFGLSEQELEQQEELVGQETMMQLKNLEETRIIADDDAKKGAAFRATGKVVEAIKNNPIFNGLTINYSNESGKVENMSKEELINYGYGHLEETKEKYIYGFYNDGDRTITLNREATRDTILEEAIHDIQYRLEEIDPSLAVLVSEWESEVREQALKEGITIPDGYELLAQSLVYTEYGYASTNPFIANLIAVDDEIVKRFTTLLGSDIAERGFGFVESEVAKEDRQLRGKYEEYTDRIFKSKYVGQTMEAKQARAAEIVQDLENVRASQYYQPYTNQYVIVGPSTKDGKYQITYFHPEFGPVSDSQHETTQEVANRLVKDGYFYKTDEIHYQLKNYDRSMADELYGRLYLQRGPGTDIDTTSDRGNVSVPINGTDIVRIREAILTGNFTEADYEQLIKDNTNLAGHDRQVLLKDIKDAEKKGLNRPNKEVTFKQFINRFYDYDIESDNDMSEYDVEKLFLYNIDSTIEKKGYLEEAKQEGWTDEYLAELVSKGKSIDDIKTRLKDQHKYFQDKTETYRHRGLQYQLKEGANADTPEFKNWFKDSKVVSDSVADNDKPLVMYHGTANKVFDEFDINKTNQFSLYGRGFYFTDDNNIATDYQEKDKSYGGIKDIVPKDTKWNEENSKILLNTIKKEIVRIENEYPIIPGSITDISFAQVPKEGKQDIKNYYKALLILERDGFYQDVVSTSDLMTWMDNMFTRDSLSYAAEKEGLTINFIRDNPGVFEAYLSIQNPFNIEEHEMTDREIGYIFGSENIEYVAQVHNRSFDRMMDFLQSTNGFDRMNEIRSTLREKLIRLGYDGITHIGGGRLGDTEHRVYIAFNPTQIKSIYNNGMFSEYDPNINYQLKESINNVDHYELKYGNSIYNNFVKDGTETNLVYKTEEQNGFSTLLVDSTVEDKDIHDMVIRDAVLDGYDYLKMGDNEPTLITNQMIEEVMTQGQPLFQLKEEPQTNGNLLAIHNLSEEQLKNTLKLGGFPFPSIAVVNKEYEHSRYGDISVLFGKNTINPTLNRKNKLYGGDAWTPTFPTISRKISTKAADALYERINNLVPADIRREYRLSLDEHNLDDQINRTGNFVDAYKYDSAMKYAYLKEQGIDIEMPTKEKQYSHEADLLDVLKDNYPVFSNEKYIDFNEAEKIKNDVISDLNSFYGVDLYNADVFGYSQMSRLGQTVYEFSKHGRETVIDYYELISILDKQINQESFEKWLNDISSGLIEKEGIRNNADYFTPSGNRRKWESLHMEVTLDNIVKIMSGKAQKGSDTMFPSFPTFAATVTDNFGSIEEMRQSSDRLVSLNEDSYSEISKQYSEKYMEIIGEMAIPSERNQFMAMDSIGEAIIESVSKSLTKQGIKKVLDSYYGLKYEDSTVDKIIELVKLVRTMPTEYFEAKPQRAVYLNEIAAVIVPDTLSPEVEQMLKDNGIHLIEKYSKEDDTARQTAINNVLRQQDVSFQLKETDTTTPAFKNWFKDSKVVDVEGQPLKVYHGTSNQFSEFRSGYAPGWGEGMYFTDNQENAKDYGNNLYEVYLNIQNPYTDDVRLSYDDLENTRAFKERQNEVPMEDGEYDYFIDARELFDTDGDFANDVIRELGYDGIIYEGSNNIEGKEIVVFNPNQIKSVNNQGTWEVNDPNIYYQMKEGPDIEERSWGQTVRDADITSPELKQILTDNKFMYEVKHNEETMINAAKLIDEKGLNWVEDHLLSELDIKDPTLGAASQILIFKFMQEGETDRAFKMINAIAPKLTTMGQAIQIFSVFGRQTPEGMLRYANETLKGAMTDKQKAKVSKTAKDYRSTFNELNKKHIREIDLVGSINQFNNLSKDELLQEALKTTKGRELVDKYGVEGILNREGISNEDKATLDGFTDRTDTNTQQIVDIVQKHYEDGKGSLKNKLVKGGMNELEADLLSKYVKEDMKNRISQEVTEKTNKLPKKDYERKGIDEQLLEKIAKGEIDEDSLRSYIAEKEGLPIMNKELGQYIYEQANYIQTLKPGRQRDIEVGKMIKEIMDHVPTSKWRKVGTFRIISMLLTGKTTMRNLLGNNMFKDLEFFTLNTVGATIDKAISIGTGNRTALFRLIDAHKVYGKGYMKGLNIGIEDALMGIDTSDSSTQFDLKQNRTFKFTHSNRGGIIGATENVVKNILPASETALDIALRATDRAASLGIVMDSLAEQMEIAGVTEATDEMMDIAIALAKYRTFQDETALSNMFSSIKRGANYIGVGGKKIEGSNKRTPNEFGMGDLIMPFPKTPANILGRAIDYSPVGAALTIYKLLSDTSGSSYLKQRMAVEGFSRAIMGTGIIAIGAVLAKMGILTGSNPDDDEDIYKLQKAHGLRDFSVNVSAIYRHLLGKDNAGELKKGDTIASYDWAEPIAMALAIGADTQLGGTTSKDLLSVVIRAWEAGVTTLTNQPLLTGLSSLFRHGDLSEGVSQLFLDMPASFTPTLFSHVAQFIDGRDTDPYTFYEGGRAVASKVMNKVPGLRANIPTRHTMLGEEKRYYPEDQNLVIRALNIFLNPSITSKYMPPAEAELLFDLYESSGDPDIVPRGPQKEYTIDKVKYTFTPETWEEMSKWLGNRYKQEIGRAMNTYMRNWSAEEQADEIKYTIKQVKNEAREKALELGTKIE